MPPYENLYMREEDPVQSSETYTRREFGRLAFGLLSYTALGNFLTKNQLAFAGEPVRVRPTPKENEFVSSFLTANLFNSEYTVDRTKADNAKEQMQGMNLETLLQTYILKLPVDAVRDFLIPTGQLEPTTHTLQSNIDMIRGMKYMWEDKVDTLRYFLKKGYISEAYYNRVAETCQVHQKKSVERMKKPIPYDAQSFFSDIQHEIEVVLSKIHAVGRKYYSNTYPLQKDPQRNIISFLQMVIDLITPHTFLAIAIQEMIASHYLSNKINPYFKRKYFDELIKKGGKEYVFYFPARYDIVNSFGPFQMTDIALSQFSREYNRYVNSEHNVPTSMSDFNTLEEHIDAALMHSYKNLETLACYLQNKGVLGKIMSKIKKLPANQKEKLIAGIIAILHHQPSPSMKSIARIHEAPDEKLLSYLAQRLSKQLLKYYESTVESYAVQVG